MKTKTFISFGLLLILAASSPGITDLKKAQALIREGNIPALKALLTSEPELAAASDDNGYTLLHFAATAGNTEIIALLLERGIDVDLKTKDGRTPLFFTIPFNQKEAMRYILGKGADLSATDNSGRSPLHHALDWGRPDIIDILLKAKIPIDGETDELTVLLEQAALLGHRRLAERLLKEGAELYTAHRKGRTMLHLAASGGLTELARRLLHEGADIDAENMITLTPLHLAAASGQVPMIRLLLEKGASISTRSADGRTPYHLALEADHEEAKAFLVARGAETNPPVFPALSPDTWGRTPPKKEAEPFAPGIISTEKWESSLTFSPDGKTCIFTRSWPGDPLGSALYVTSVRNGRWVHPEPLLPNSWHGEIGVSFSPSGKSLFFASRHPVGEAGENKRDFDLWEMEKAGSGWSKPHHLGHSVNSEAHELSPSLSAQGNLYYHRNGILKASRIDGSFTSPVEVGEHFTNVSGGGHPFVSVDESFLIFDARSPSQNQTDLFIVFRDHDGTWTKPMSLGDDVNSPDQFELYAWVSPDHRRLFFQRDNDIYWVGGKIIYAVKSRALRPITTRGGQIVTSFGKKAESLLPCPPRSQEHLDRIGVFKEDVSTLDRQFTSHIYTNRQGERMPYRLFTPKHIESGIQYPLVVFLHGSSGSGRDNEKQLSRANMFGSLLWALPENQERHPCYILAPQTDVNWPCVIIEPGKRPKLCPGLGMGAKLAFEIIDKVTEEQAVDKDRIYVTGHSMGGAGTWHMIAQRPDFFAAAVPVSGLPDLSTAPLIKDIPIWNFHGEIDNIEPVATSRRMIAEVTKAGGQPLHTEFPGVGHNVFMWVYTEPGLVEWLFAQHR